MTKAPVWLLLALAGYISSTPSLTADGAAVSIVPRGAAASQRNANGCFRVSSLERITFAVEVAFMRDLPSASLRLQAPTENCPRCDRSLDNVSIVVETSKAPSVEFLLFGSGRGTSLKGGVRVHSVSLSVAIPSDPEQRASRIRSYLDELSAEDPVAYRLMVGEGRTVEGVAAALAGIWIDHEPGIHSITATYFDSASGKQFTSQPTCFDIYYIPYPETLMKGSIGNNHHGGN